MKVIGASWDLRMARFRWTDAPIELRFRRIDRSPYLCGANFFLGAFLLVTLLSFREKCFLAFSPSKNRKSPDFLGSFKLYERKLFCVKLSKRSDDFWPFFITRGTFGTFWPFLAKNGYFGTSARIVHNHWWMDVCMYISSCWFLSILIRLDFFLSSTFSTVINFFNPRFYTYSFCL